MPQRKAVHLPILRHWAVRRRRGRTGRPAQPRGPQGEEEPGGGGQRGETVTGAWGPRLGDKGELRGRQVKPSV